MLCIVKIQARIRGFLVRIHRLPLILYRIQYYLSKCTIQFSTQTEDGRINSCVDEDEIIKLLLDKFGRTHIKKPKIRMWFDLLVLDTMVGWIPVNIKTTTTLTSDNTGNLAMCVYAYTDELLDIHREKSYENGPMSVLLIDKLQQRKYNRRPKKDY